MNLYTINTGFFKLDGGAMFGVVPKSIWKNLNPADENNLCTWAMRCLLIEDGKKLVLIDCGMGNKQSQKFFSYYQPHGDDTLEKSLKKHGFSTDDVTDIILTHLHFDHCGGAIKKVDEKYIPTFRNAVYWSEETHWNWAINPNDREKASFLKENILPIQESRQLRFLKKGNEIFSGFDFILSNGHTEAMVIPHIRYNDKTIVYVADMIPSSDHIPVPYVMGYDIRPLVTMGEKKNFLEKACREKYILFFEHDRVVECCSLKIMEGRVKTDQAMKLEEAIS